MEQFKIRLHFDFHLFLSTVLAKPVKQQQQQPGQSSIAYSQDHKGNYQFAYEISEKGGASNFRQESRNGKVVRGSYGLTDVDGRTRLVNYQADKHGFVAAIDTNEPGTSREDAAHAIYNGPDKGKGWAYAVSVQEQPPPPPPKKNPKKPTYTATAVHSDMEDEHRYSENLDEEDKEDYHQVSSNSARPNSSFVKSKEPFINTIYPSSPSLETYSSTNNKQSKNRPLVSSSSSSSSYPSSTTADSNSDEHISDGVSHDFLDEKPNSSSLYSDTSKSDNRVEDESNSSEIDNPNSNDYEYRRRNFSNQKVSSTSTPSSSPYSKTIQKLAHDRFKPNKNIYVGNKRNIPVNLKASSLSSSNRLSSVPVRMSAQSPSYSQFSSPLHSSRPLDAVHAIPTRNPYNWHK